MPVWDPLHDLLVLPQRFNGPSWRVVMVTDDGHQPTGAHAAQRLLLKASSIDRRVAALGDPVHQHAHPPATLSWDASRIARSRSTRSMSAAASVMCPWTTTPPARSRSSRSMSVTCPEGPPRASGEAYNVRPSLTRPLRSCPARS